MADGTKVDLPWLFAAGYFPTGQERNPSPDIPVLAAGRWSYKPLPRLPFRFAPSEATSLSRLAIKRR